MKFFQTTDRQVKTILFFFINIFFLSSCGENYDDILSKVPEYLELVKTTKKIDTFAQFPSMDIWRILIDGRKHSSGPMVFDKEEPGYLAGISKGMNFALSNIDTPITVEFLEELRSNTVKEVSKINGTKFEPEMGGGAVQFPLNIGSNATVLGLAELEQKLKGQTLRRFDKNNKGEKVLLRTKITREKIIPMVNKIIDRYYNSNQSLQDMIIMSQDLDQLHPFNDGNTRTFDILLLQKELARKKQTPVILYNPNRFGAYSVAELIDDVKAGQEVFKSYLSGYPKEFPTETTSTNTSAGKNTHTKTNDTSFRTAPMEDTESSATSQF